MSSPAPWADMKTRLIAANIVSTGLIQFPNEVFVQPDPPAPWLNVESTSHDLAPVDIGAGVWQEDGTLYVDVLVPAYTGSDTARTLAKAVATTFRGVTATPATPVIYTSAKISSADPSGPQGNWFRLTVSVEWRYQDILS